MTSMDRVERWTAELGLPGLTDPLDPLGQAIGVQLYRMLAAGAPVRLLQVADELGVTVEAVDNALTGRPGIVRDDTGNVTAYLGLTLKPTPHRISFDENTLYTWCAWDTMLVAHLLGRDLEVISPCVVSGVDVGLTLTGDGIAKANPSSTRVSMVTPTLEALADDFHAAFCGRIHFLADDEAGRTWLNDNPDGLTLTLSEAFNFARIRNERVFGTALGVAA